ncbi:MAG: hypothetical protein NVS2B11_06500 [Acetobacteraceae bacterium]
MTPDELRAAPEAPAKGAAIEALWWAAREDWTHAHELAQADHGAPAAWVHAYLHRVEGDPENAAYWYERAGKPVATAPLDDEWRAIAAALLSS